MIYNTPVVGLRNKFVIMSYDALVGMKQAMTHWLFDYDNLVMSYDIFVI